MQIFVAFSPSNTVTITVSPPRIAFRKYVSIQVKKIPREPEIARKWNKMGALKPVIFTVSAIYYVLTKQLESPISKKEKFGITKNLMSP